jgi:hypothetical protein
VTNYRLVDVFCTSNTSQFASFGIDRYAGYENTTTLRKFETQKVEFTNVPVTITDSRAVNGARLSFAATANESKTVNNGVSRNLIEHDATTFAGRNFINRYDDVCRYRDAA